MTRFEGLQTQHYETKQQMIGDLLQRSTEVSLFMARTLTKTGPGRLNTVPSCLKGTKFV